jgi:hypothetical protein
MPERILTQDATFVAQPQHSANGATPNANGTAGAK